MLKPAEEIEITDADMSFADDIIASRIEILRDRMIPNAIFESCLFGVSIFYIVVQTRREIDDYLAGGAVALVGLGLFLKTLITFRAHRNELLNQKTFYATLNARRRHQRGVRTLI